MNISQSAVYFFSVFYDLFYLERFVYVKENLAFVVRINRDITDGFGIAPSNTRSKTGIMEFFMP